MGLVYLPTFGSHHNIDCTSKPLSSLLTNQDFYPNVGVEIIVRLTLGDFLLPRVGLNVTQWPWWKEKGCRAPRAARRWKDCPAVSGKSCLFFPNTRWAPFSYKWGYSPGKPIYFRPFTRGPMSLHLFHDRLRRPTLQETWNLKPKLEIPNLEMFIIFNFQLTKSLKNFIKPCHK